MSGFGSCARRGFGIGPVLLFCAALLWPLAPGTQQVYRLYYDWSLGRHYEFSVYIVGQITTGAEGKKDVRAKFTDVWHVDLDDARGQARVLEKAENYTGPSFDIRSFGLPLPGPVVERLVDKSGRVQTVVGYPPEHPLALLPVVLPDVPVALEGKWTLRRKMLFPVIEREELADTTVIYTLEEIARNYKGSRRSCARIRVDGNYSWLAADGASGVTGAFSGKVFFDLVELKIVDYQMTANRKEFQKPDKVRTSSFQITCITNAAGNQPGMPSFQPR